MPRTAQPKINEEGKAVIRGGRKICPDCGKSEQQYYLGTPQRCVKCCKEKNRKRYYERRGLPVPPRKSSGRGEARRHRSTGKSQPTHRTP